MLRCPGFRHVFFDCLGNSALRVNQKRHTTTTQRIPGCPPSRASSLGVPQHDNAVAPPELAGWPGLGPGTGHPGMASRGLRRPCNFVCPCIFPLCPRIFPFPPLCLAPLLFCFVFGFFSKRQQGSRLHQSETCTMSTRKARAGARLPIGRLSFLSSSGTWLPTFVFCKRERISVMPGRRSSRKHEKVRN